MSRRRPMLALLLLGFAPRPAGAQWLDHKVPPRPASVDAEAGRAVYQERCWFCHGEQGDGQGPIAAYLWPRPRDFTTGTYLLRTTESGELPTDEDVYRTLSVGIPGTSMPAWEAILSPAERWAVIGYLKTFAADLFADPGQDPYKRVVTLSDPPRWGRDSLLAHGRRVFEQGQCLDCHGQAGRGDGGRGADLKDDWDYPRPSADLTYAWKFKGGRSVREIYLRFTNGLNGTPMPSYAETLSDEDRWALANYVVSLDRSPDEQAGGVVIAARRVEGAPPLDPAAPEWQRAPVVPIPVTGQATFPPRWQTPAITDLDVQALYGDGQLAVRLAWHDRTADTLAGDPALALAEGWQADDTYPVLYPDGNRTHGRFADAAELMFPAQWNGRAELPHLVYGGGGRAVDLLRWRAEVSTGGEAPVMQLSANGADKPPEPQPQDQWTGVGRGSWVDGRWVVVIRRPLPEVPQGGFLPIAFHLWDGGNGETGLRMDLSSWYYLRIDTGSRASGYLAALLVALVVLGLESGAVRWVRARAARHELTQYGIGPAGGEPAG